MKISVVIVAKNEEQDLPGCLASVRFADEVVVIDDHSTDKTVELAKASGAKVYKRKLDGFATQKNFGIDKTTNDWVLILDADERLSIALQKEIQALRPIKGIVAYKINFQNHLGKKWLKHGGLYPDPHVRLFNKKFARYGDREIHEQLNISGKTGKLKNDIIHYTYASFKEYKAKVEKYAKLEAKADTKRPSPIHPYRVFLIHYIKENGYKDGWAGFRSAWLLAHYQVLKRRYMK